MRLSQKRVCMEAGDKASWGLENVSDNTAYAALSPPLVYTIPAGDGGEESEPTFDMCIAFGDPLIDRALHCLNGRGIVYEAQAR